MAIDDEDKRRSVIQIPPTPDGDLDDDQDRMHIAGFYRGIAPTGAVPVTRRPGDLLLKGVG